MPVDSSFVDPELFLEHKGVEVYHIYKNDDVAQGRREFWYTLSPLCGEDNCSDERCGDTCVMQFDVRDLPNYEHGKDNPGGFGADREYHAGVISEAIDRGDLVEPTYADEDRVEVPDEDDEDDS